MWAVNASSFVHSKRELFHAEDVLQPQRDDAHRATCWHSCDVDFHLRLIQKAQGGLDDQKVREALLQDLLSETLQGPTSRLLDIPVEKMAFRELPPGNWAQLYVLYQSHCLAQNDEAASRSVFYRVTQLWRKRLKFRKRSQHGICEICDRIKAEMRHSGGFLEHAKWADRLLGHLAMTWRARQKYWEARATSRAKQDLLRLIVDGYDKSKPCLPRWGLGRAPKGGAFEKHPRTGMQFSAVIAHGWGCAIFMAAEHVSCGGPYTWETLLLTMDMVWKQARKEGRQAPKSFLVERFMWRCVLRLWVQGDNTVKELKNALSGQMIAMLIAANLIEEGGHFHLPKGHTHEDVGRKRFISPSLCPDGLFGLFTNVLDSMGDQIQTPQDFKRPGSRRASILPARLLETRVGPVFERRGEFFNVVLVDGVAHLPKYRSFEM